MYERKCPTEALEDDLHLLALCLPRSKRHVCAIIPFAIGSAPAGENVGLYVDFGAIDGGWYCPSCISAFGPGLRSELYAPNR